MTLHTMHAYIHTFVRICLYMRVYIYVKREGMYLHVFYLSLCLCPGSRGCNKVAPKASTPIPVLQTRCGPLGRSRLSPRLASLPSAPESWLWPFATATSGLRRLRVGSEWISLHRGSSSLRPLQFLRGFDESLRSRQFLEGLDDFVCMLQE